MSLQRDTKRLRSSLRRLVERPNKKLLFAYSFIYKPKPIKLPTPYVARLRVRLSHWYRERRIREPEVQHQWSVALKHVPVESSNQVLLIWAVDTVGVNIRDACIGLADFLADNQDLTSVLVTDKADFAWYSRLGWLVEYVPNINGDESYKRDKIRYLAWRYRNAIVVPIRAGLADCSILQELIESGKEQAE